MCRETLGIPAPCAVAFTARGLEIQDVPSIDFLGLWEAADKLQLVWQRADVSQEGWMLLCKHCVVRWVSTHGFQCGICELHTKDPQNVTSQRQPAGFWFAEQESAAHPRGQNSSSLAVLDHHS